MSVATPDALATATASQPTVASTLSAGLAGGPSHAYLFAGPPGSGRRSTARAFAAELLADGAADPDDARRRALADPSPHPDLVWLEPPGNQHLVDEVRDRVISAAAYRPFEGARRVFVIAAAEALAEESQNALLKTLEEPAPFAHLILIAAEPEALLETVRSRCLTVSFRALDPDALASSLAERHPGSGEAEREAVARLAAGDLTRAELLLASAEGRALRAAAEDCARRARAGELEAAPWRALLDSAEAAGEAAASRALEHGRLLAAESGEEEGPGARRRARDAEEAAKRAGRRERTAALDLGLALIGSWLRDLVAVAEGAPELVLARDREAELRADAEGLDPRRARRAAELVLDTRRRLQVNVAEELALEALLFRVEYVLRHG